MEEIIWKKDSVRQTLEEQIWKQLEGQCCKKDYVRQNDGKNVSGRNTMNKNLEERLLKKKDSVRKTPNEKCWKKDDGRKTQREKLWKKDPERTRARERLETKRS